MYSHHGKVFALSTAAVGVVVFVAAGIAAKDRIREQWYLNQLQIGSEPEKLEAVNRLGEMRSARAVPILFQELRRAAGASYAGRKGAIFLFGDPRNQVGRWDCPVSKALVEIGKPALPEILRAAADHDDFVSGLAGGVAVDAFMRIEPELDEPITSAMLRRESGGGSSAPEPIFQQMCRLLARDPNRPLDVRQAAAEVLAKVQSR